MKIFKGVPQRLVSLLLAVIMVMTMLPAQGLLSIAAAESGGITSQTPEEGNGLPGEGEELPATGVEGPVEPLPILQLTVYYVYGESAGTTLAGSPAAQPHVKTLAQGSAYTVESPVIPGFAPDTAIVDGTLEEDTDVYVTYEADGAVDYTVVHTFAGLVGDGSDDRVVTETKSGTVGDITQAVAMNDPGFTAGEFAQTEIAAGGGTSIAIDYSRNEYAIYFITDGGNYVDTQIKKFGEDVLLDVVAEPKKPGYSFGGWFSDAGCTAAAEASFAMPAQDVELYALWSDDNSKYTVLFWLEQADPKTPDGSDYGYDHYDSLGLTAPVKSTITASDAMAAALAANPDMVPEIYEYDASAANNQESITLSGTGEEVLNIYLKRKSVTVKFQTFRYGPEVTNSRCTLYLQSHLGVHNADGSHNYNLGYPDNAYEDVRYPYPCVEVNGVWMTQRLNTSNVITTDYLTVTGRAGEKFGAQENKAWPETLDDKSVQWLTSTSPDERVYQGKMERMPLASVTYYAEQASQDASLFQINYLIEMLPEDTSAADKTKNGKNYKLYSQNDFWSTTQMGLVNHPNTSYEIAGFTYEKDLSEDFPQTHANDNPKRDVYSAYVFYSRDSATITFGAAGNDVVGMPESIKRLFDQKIGTAIAEPTRKGYAFAGWSTAQYGTSANFILNADSTMPAGGAVLYAVWKPESYTVTFDLNHDGAPAADVQQVSYQKLATQPTDPVREGYKFMGWYTTATGSQRYVFDKPVEDNVTLYAQWTADTIASYTLKHVDADTQIVMRSETKENIRVGTTVTVNALAIPGYAPLVSSKSQQIVAGNNEIVLEYKAFTALPYTVRYLDTAGNTIGVSEKLVNNDGPDRKATVTENFVSVSGYTPDRFQKTLDLVYETTIEKNVITFTYTKNLPGVYRVYYFEATENGDQSVVTSKGPIVDLPVGEKAIATPTPPETHVVNTSKSTLSGTITTEHVNRQTPLILRVYYDWKEYDVTYNPNNTVLDNTVVTQPVKHGKNATAAPADTFKAEAHKVFLGWAESADATAPTYMAGGSINNVTAPKTLYAIWGAEAQYNLTYNANNGGSGTQTFDGGKHYADTPATAATIVVTGFTAPTGQKFTGWSSTVDGDVAYAENAQIPVTADTELYAVWTNMNKNTVTYNGNGGKLPNGDASWVEERFENATATVKDNSFVLDGYKFAGWSDGTKSWEVNETVPAGTDLTLTAQWTEDRTQWVTLSYDANGGTNAPAEQKILRSALKATLEGKGSMTHGTNIFGGWSATAIAPAATKAAYDAAKSQLITEIAFNVQYSKYTVYAVWYVDVNGPEGNPDTTPDALQYQAVYRNFYLPTDGSPTVSGTPPVEARIYKSGELHTVLGPNTLKLEKAVFVGWVTEYIGSDRYFVKTKEELAALKRSVPFFESDAKLEMIRSVGFDAVWAPDVNGDGTPDYDQLTVTYLPGADDATGTTEDNNLYNSNAEVEVKANRFVRPDYMFTGWVSNTNTAASAGDKFPITASITFTAQWKLDENGPDGGPDQIPDEDEFGITYFANGGTGDVPVNSNIYPVNANAPVEFVTNLTKTGYTFLGWDTSPLATAPAYTASGLNTVAMPDGGVKLYAIYGANVVTYNVKHIGTRTGTDGSPLEVDLGNELGKTGTFGETLTLSAKNPVGYTLNGDATQTVTLGETGNDYTFRYIINKYDVVYKPNNSVEGNTEQKVTVEHGNGTTAPENSFAPETHMVFKGWDTNPDATTPTYNVGDPINNVTESKTLYAIWILEDKYTVTYNANNGGLGTQTYNGGDYFSDESAKALSNDVTGFTEPAGKKFEGWSTTPNGIVEYAADANIPMTDKADRQLYAVWGNRDQNTITYNGGAVDSVSGKLPGGATTEQVKRFNNEDGTVKDNSFVLDGYKFAGWSDGTKSWEVNETVPAGTDLTLTAQWTEDRTQWVTLSYDANGGANAPAEQKILRSALKAILEGKGGMTHGTNIFGGWSATAIAPAATKAAYDAAQSQLITEIAFNEQYSKYTVYAVWYVDVNGPEGKPDTTPDALQFAVTYVGGADDATGKTADDKLYSTTDDVTLEPNGFARDNYVFSGWSVPNQEGIWQPAQKISIAGHTTVTALWKEDKNGPDGGPDGTPDEIQYAVTYDANGGTGEVPVNNNIYSVNAEAPVVFTPAPAKTGYNFLGWDTNPLATAATYTAGGKTAVTMPENGVKLYAIYGAGNVTYKVEYVSILNGANKILDTDTGSGKFDQALTLTAKTFTGYTLTSANTQNVTLGATASNVYTFYYAPDVVAVVAQYRDGTDSTKLVADDATQTGPYYFGEQYSLNAIDVTGWTVREGTQTFTITEIGMQEVMFLYDIDVYTITYEPNNSVVGNTKYSVNVNHGASSTVPENAFIADAHMLFKGWSENENATAVDTLIQPNTTISNLTGSKTLYAIWVEEDKYTITYNANNGGSGIQTFDGGDHFADTPAKAAELAATGFTEPSGKKFTGWSTTPEGRVAYAAGADIPMTDKTNKQLYAVWTDRSKNTVTYNGGAVDGVPGKLPSGATSDTEERFNNEDGTVKDNSFVLDGYKFAGWSDGTKSWEVNETVPAGTDLTLTAQWEKDRTQWVTLSYDANGGTNAPAEQEILRSALKAILEGKGSMTHGTNIFGGWSAAAIAPAATKAEYDAAQSQLITEITFNEQYSKYTVYAVWYVDVNGPEGNPDTTPDALQFAVTYVGGADDATGSAVDSNLYSTADEVTLLANSFVRKDYVFVGWSVPGEIDTKQPADKIFVAGNTEVTALWKLDKKGPDGGPDGTPDEIQYTLTYDANGGTGEVPVNNNIYSVNAEAPVVFTPAPAKTGYTFFGWDTNPLATTPTYTATGKTTVTMPENGVKLYAIYGANAVSYNVKYVSRRTNDKGVVVEKTLEDMPGLAGNFGQTLTLTAKEFTGYTLTSAATQNVTLGETGNDFTFYYAPNAATVVSHYLDSVTNEKLLEDQNWGVGYQYGVTYEMKAPEITGFTANNPVESFTIAGELHEVTFLYTRNQYAYEIRYQNANGETLVVPTTGREAYKAIVTAKPVAVPSYTPRDAELKLEIGTDETKNVIIFIYDYTGGGGGVTDPDDDDDDTSSSSTSTTPATSTPTTPITPVTPPEVVVTPPAQVEIDDEDSPLAPGAQVTGPTEVIDDEETPLAAGVPAWALINLLLTILTALIMLVLFIGYYTGKKKDEDENTQAAQATAKTAAEQEDEDDLKRKGWMRLLSIIPTVGAIVAFILTENMRNPMVLVDRWTLWMAVIALVQIGVAFCCRKERKDDKEDSNKEMPSTDVAPQNV